MSWSVSVSPGPVNEFVERADQAQSSEPCASYFRGDNAEAKNEQYELVRNTADNMLSSAGWEGDLASCTLSGHVKEGEGSAGDSMSIYLSRAT